MKKLNLKAIIWGFIASVISAVVVTIALMIAMYLLYWLAPTMGMPEEASERINALLPENARDWMSLSLVLIAAFFGGYVTGRISKKDIYFNCVALIALNFLLAIPFLSAELRGLDNLSLALTIPATLFGGLIAKQKIQRIELRSAPSSRRNENGEF